MDKKLYFAPELEVIKLNTQMAIMAGSFNDPDGEGGDANMDDTPHGADDF